MLLSGVVPKVENIDTASLVSQVTSCLARKGLQGDVVYLG
jgi:hypothetical protein